MNTLKVVVVGVAMVIAGFAAAPIASASPCSQANAAINAHNARYNPNESAAQAAAYNAEADSLQAIADAACSH